MKKNTVNDFQGLLEEIFNPEKSFTQTEIIEKCTYCDFKALCKRLDYSDLVVNPAA